MSSDLPGKDVKIDMMFNFLFQNSLPYEEGLID